MGRSNPELPEKLDSFRPDSVDRFLRIEWTTWTGLSGQLRPDLVDSLGRITQGIQHVRQQGNSSI
jgi:hypothetical protein